MLNQGYDNLAEVIAGIEKSLRDAAPEAKAAIDKLVHDAAVGLLHSALPPMVHTHNGLTRAGAWTRVQALTAEMSLDLAGATVNNAILAGHVAEKVNDGVGHITSNLEYAGGVDSIT